MEEDEQEEVDQEVGFLVLERKHQEEEELLRHNMSWNCVLVMSSKNQYNFF